MGYIHGRSRYLRLSELEEDSVLPRLPPSCAAISPHGPSWLGKRGPQGGIWTSTPPALLPAPTLIFQEGASDPTGSTHLPSPGPRASQRHPQHPLGSLSPHRWPPVASPGPSPVAAHRGPPSWSDASILRGPRPSPHPPLPVVAPLPLAKLQSRQRHRRRALLRRWERGRAEAGLGRSCRLSGNLSAGRPGPRVGGGNGRGPPRAGRASMIGVNSIHSSAGRLRSRSLCSVRYGRTHRGAETLCYGWPQRSRSLKPVLYTDLVVSRLQSRKKKKAVRVLGRRPTPGWGVNEGVAEGG